MNRNLTYWPRWKALPADYVKMETGHTERAFLVEWKGAPTEVDAPVPPTLRSPGSDHPAPKKGATGRRRAQAKKVTGTVLPPTPGVE